MSVTGILSAFIIVFSEGLILQGPSSPLQGKLGGVLQLPCSVIDPVPLDELEVEWRRIDSKALVHLFQGGESRPESQSYEYRDRAHFFTTAEIAKGNYSLTLYNVTIDDAGSYICSVFTKQDSSEMTVEVETIERLVLTGPDHAVSAYAGGEVILDCAVDSHIPAEEVSWKKVDSDESLILVLLFQDNKTSPGHASYQGRAEFFTTEIPKGNFSLRLKEVRTEDKGEYICEAHSGHLSANITVKLQQLGLSSMHILVLTLCASAIIVALLVSAVILKDIKAKSSSLGETCPSLGKHYVLVFLPSVIMFIAFVLWGVIEGFLSEVVTCSTVNLIRFILLFKISLYQEHLPDMVKTLMKTGFFIEYYIIFSVVYYVIFYDVWRMERESKPLAFMSVMCGSFLHMNSQGFFGGGGYMDMTDMFFLFAVSFLSRTFNQNAFISMFAGGFLLPLSTWVILLITTKRYPFLQKSELYFLGFLAYFFIRRLILSIIVFYFVFQFLENNEECAGLLSVAALLQLLALAGWFDTAKPSLAETPKIILYMYGAFGVLAVNSITLATELMLKLRNGQRTVDLRVVVLPFECVFVLGWIVLWSHAYWRRDQKRIKTEVAVCQRYGCTRWVQILKDEDKSPLMEFEGILMQPAPPPAESNTPPENPLEPSPETETEINAAEDTDTKSSEQLSTLQVRSNNRLHLSKNMGAGYIFSLTLLAFCEAFNIQGPLGPLSAPLGGSVVLPCSVEPPLPVEELEIEWRRTDSYALVHLFQEGDARPESQDHDFRDRAFFFKDELIKGNYSLLITSVIREDTGAYICKVYTNQESNEVTAEISDIEYLVLKGAGVVSGYVGKEVVMGCAVDSNVPSERLEKVTWKRTDQDILVLLYHLGVVLPNSSHERYQGRAEVFTTEIPKGNFSLRLKDVRTEDKGEYICEAHSGHLSANTTVKLQQLGSHPVLILASILSLTAITVALGLGVPVYRSLDLLAGNRGGPNQSEEDLTHARNHIQRVKLMNMLLIFCPNIIIFMAFMLYGITLGFLGEIVTCGTVNFVRFLPLLKSTPRILLDSKSPEEMKKYVRYDGVTAMLEYYFIAGVLFSGVFANISILGINAYYVGFTAGIYLLFYFLEIFGGHSQCSCFTYIDIINWVLLWLLHSVYSTLNIYMFITTLVFTLGMNILFHCTKPDHLGPRTGSDHKLYTMLMLVLVPLYMMLFIGQVSWTLADVKGGPGLICGSALLYLLTALSGCRHSCLTPESDRDAGFCGLYIYIFGSIVLPVLNSATLFVELMVRLWTGARYITDLRVFVLPFECIFALERHVLKLYLYWKQPESMMCCLTSCGDENGCH
ncbi:hypothetical protein ACEWY4_015240 [Coilia grayii]|uniref:Ig-like domain-containing protein n=1 Tax=Coilia grayii TaxID=363190 RepID=A0ABD1JPM0_9TELE